MSSRWWSRLAAALGSIGLVGSLLLAAAGPLSAASTSKTYTVTVSPKSLAYSTPSVSSPFTVTYQNLTPSATINSLTLTAPSGYQITTSPSLSASSGNLGNDSVVVDPTGTKVTVTNLYPVGYLQTLTLTFTATANTSSLTCSTMVGTWATQAWTGSNTSGTLFTLSSPAPTTTIGTALAAGDSITVNGVTVTNQSTQCELITIDRSSTANSVQVNKPTVAGLPLTVDILWNPEPAPLPNQSVPLTQVDTPSPSHAIQWCGGTATSPTMPSGEVSCLISESTQIAGSNTVQVHDVIYLLGDWGAAR